MCNCCLPFVRRDQFTILFHYIPFSKDKNICNSILTIRIQYFNNMIIFNLVRKLNNQDSSIYSRDLHSPLDEISPEPPCYPPPLAPRHRKKGINYKLTRTAPRARILSTGHNTIPRSARGTREFEILPRARMSLARECGELVRASLLSLLRAQEISL